MNSFLHKIERVQNSVLEDITVQYSKVQCSTVYHSTVQYSTAQYSIAQCSTVQYSTVQYSTVQYSRVENFCVDFILSSLHWSQHTVKLTVTFTVPSSFFMYVFFICLTFPVLLLHRFSSLSTSNFSLDYISFPFSFI